MTEITINLDQYNLLFEKAMSFDKIVEAVRNNIDKNDIYPVDSDEILLLTGLAKYMHEHMLAMANSAEAKLVTSLKEQIENQKTQIAALNEEIERMQMKPEQEPEEEENHAEDQTEL